ncbi:hypothetical protein ACHAXR_003432 [Thalassiosira sp. AJA248-18]
MVRQFFVTAIAATVLLRSPASGFMPSFGPTVQPNNPSSLKCSSHQVVDDENLQDIAPTPNIDQETETLPMMPSTNSIRWGNAPYLALLTEPDACTSVERVEETIRAIDQATTMDGGVSLVVVRVANSGPGDESALLKWALLKNLAEMKQRRRFLLVVNDDVDIVLRALSQNITVDGVHVKEHNSHLIPSIRRKLEHAITCSFDKNDGLHKNIIIGTSCHSIKSAMRSYQLSPRGPDYLFVGTCYLTQSHPEKQSLDELEGPTLPGAVKRELYERFNCNKDDETTDTKTISQSTSTVSPPPIIFAIGGIDEHNCHEPVVTFGADGVATIRTVMQSSDPNEVVRLMKNIMQNTNDDV